jgi:oxygen-independent coproporphyrinogen-3 oxidase
VLVNLRVSIEAHCNRTGPRNPFANGGSATPIGKLSPAFFAKLDICGPRYTSYPTVPVWQKSFGPQDYAVHLAEAGRRGAEAPLSLYVHLPFCSELCAYCGCNVVVTRDPRKPDSYLDHLAQEMDLVARRLGPRRRVSQLHWGGGTPTFLSNPQIERLWRDLTRRFDLVADAEVAVEIDPVVTPKEKLALLRSLRFNRLSMGVQDFDPDVQRAVRRVQTIEQTREALAAARELGFSGINFDLICGLPLQTPAGWRRTMESVADMRPDRIAVYSFAFVPAVRPHQRSLAGFSMPAGRDKLELRAITDEVLCGSGYRSIGMDHFALPSDELAQAQECRRLRRNFQGYTTQPAADVVAFGVTGISDVQGAYAQNLRPLRAYFAAITRGEFATERGIRLSAEDMRRREVIESLMCNFWVNLDGLDASSFGREIEALRDFEDEGLVEMTGSAITVTPLGRPFVRNVAMIFDAYLRAGPSVPFSRTI